MPCRFLVSWPVGRSVVFVAQQNMDMQGNKTGMPRKGETKKVKKFRDGDVKNAGSTHMSGASKDRSGILSNKSKDEHSREGSK